MQMDSLILLRWYKMALKSSEWYLLTINEVGENILCWILESDNTHTHLRTYPALEIKLLLTGDIIDGEMIQKDESKRIKDKIDKNNAQEEVKQRILTKHHEKAMKEIERQK